MKNKMKIKMMNSKNKIKIMKIIAQKKERKK